MLHLARNQELTKKHNTKMNMLMMIEKLTIEECIAALEESGPVSVSSNRKYYMTLTTITSATL